MAIQTVDNKYGVSKWIVDPVLGRGTHQTITAAIASAAAGDDIFIRPGTAGLYTEDFTITPGVNLVAFLGDADTPHVTIVGKITMLAAGTSSISNIRLQTNSDFSVVVSGSVASILNLNNCYLNCPSGVTGNTAISFTSSSASANINVINCRGDLGKTGIAYHSSSSAGTLIYTDTFLGNSGSSTTASSNSAGSVIIRGSGFTSPISTSGTGIIINDYSFVDCDGLNVTALTTAGTGALNVSLYGFYKGGTASAVVVGAGTTLTSLSDIMVSTNVNSVNGTGSIIYGAMDMGGNTALNNVSTKTGKQLQVGSISFDGGVTVLNALPVPVTVGGTGRATLTNHGVLVGAGTAAISQTATGSAGQVLQSNGAAADPTFSTATFPATAGSTGTILRSDGTNWVATTATYPATTTINQVLYSSAANTISGLTTANRAVLNTDGSGVPSMIATPQITGLGIGAASTGSGLTFDGSNTISNYVVGTFTPTMVGTVAGSTTYTNQQGFYTRIGGIVQVQADVAGSAATGTGAMILGALPFTIKNNSTGAIAGTLISASAAGWVWPAGTSSMAFDGTINTTTGRAYISGTATVGGFLQMANAAFEFIYNLTYEI